MTTREVVLGWAGEHGYEVVYEGSGDPNLVIVGESHGVYGCGKAPEFLRTQLELIRRLRPTDLAIEDVEEYWPYENIDTNFGDMHGYFMRSTAVDLHRLVSKLDQQGKLRKNSSRRKIAGLVFNWPKNLYKKEAEIVGADVHLIDDEELHERQEELVEQTGDLGGFEGYVVAADRSYAMAEYLKRLQGLGTLTLSVMGNGHTEHIVDQFGYMESNPDFLPEPIRRQIIILAERMPDPERTIIVDQGDYNGPGTGKDSYKIGRLILQSMADMLEIWRDD